MKSFGGRRFSFLVELLLDFVRMEKINRNWKSLAHVLTPDGGARLRWTRMKIPAEFFCDAFQNFFCEMRTVTANPNIQLYLISAPSGMKGKKHLTSHSKLLIIVRGSSNTDVGLEILIPTNRQLKVITMYMVYPRSKNKTTISWAREEKCLASTFIGEGNCRRVQAVAVWPWRWCNQ